LLAELGVPSTLRIAPTDVPGALTTKTPGAVGCTGTWIGLEVTPFTLTWITVEDCDPTSNGTLIGNALLTAIDALSKVNSDIAPSTLKLNAADKKRQRFISKYVPDIVVLLTDGAATGGVDPIDAAHQAADRRVRIYTIGFGTANPAPLVCTADQLGADSGPPFGGGGGGFRPNFGGGGPGGGRRNFLEIDDATLKSVAKITGGTYSPARSAQQLESVFRTLPRRVETQKEEKELSVYLVALAALLATAAVALSLWWNRYP